MSRTADGGGVNYVRCAVGACAAGGTGPFTIISLVRLNIFQAVSGVIQLRNSVANANRRELMITGAKMFGTGDFSSGFGTIPSDGTTWAWVVERKAAGSAHYEFAYASYPVADPDTDIIFGEAPDAANHGDPGTGDEIWIGETDIHWRGANALDAWFNSRLSDAAIKSALTTRLVDIMALTPAGCWPLNDVGSVVDVTGNGADEIETIGTVTMTDDPAGYDFVLVTTVDLSIASAAQAQTATSAALTQAHNIVTADASQAQNSTTVGNLIAPGGTLSGAVADRADLEGAVLSRTVALAGTIE
jgi:hypothetical protein